MKRIKIFGERNTSTNALKKLIEENSNSHVAPSVIREVDPKIGKVVDFCAKAKAPADLRELIIDYGFSNKTAINSWKHTCTNFDSVDDLKGVHVVFCVRHPASWILGMYRRPYHIQNIKYDDLQSFLKAKWKTVSRERLQNASVSATETYNKKIKSYLQLQKTLEDSSISYSVVRHEDFAIDQLEVFSKIKIHLEDPKTRPQKIEKSTKNDGKSSEYYKEYYGNNLWLKDIDSRSLETINAEIDWDQISSYEYFPIPTGT